MSDAPRIVGKGLNPRTVRSERGQEKVPDGWDLRGNDPTLFLAGPIQLRDVNPAVPGDPHVTRWPDIDRPTRQACHEAQARLLVKLRVRGFGKTHIG